MRKISFLMVSFLFAFYFAGNVWAQSNETKAEPYIFTDIKEIKSTSIKNQNRSSTCWSFSGIAFLESELIRMGNPAVDLSPMYVVRNIYAMKADRYVRFNGTNNFGPGGSFFDVLEAIKRFGIVPLEVYPGLNYGEDLHVHGELDALTKAFVDVIIKNPNKKISTAWKAAFDGILDAYLGKVPENFTYYGKNYTPKSFVKFLGLNPDDYVVITSFNHHPFYQKFVLELPDNWIHGEAYNVSIADFERILDFAIDNGFPVAWASDVSDKGFNWSKGVAIVPDINDIENAGSDKERWTRLSNKEKEKVLYAFDKPVKEMTITQELRQLAFDNYQTTDDHGMVLVGKANDQQGNTFFKVKNSWGADGVYKGYFYASKAFVLYKTTNIMVHKKAIPMDIQKKLGI